MMICPIGRRTQSSRAGTESWNRQPLLWCLCIPVHHGCCPGARLPWPAARLHSGKSSPPRSVSLCPCSGPLCEAPAADCIMWLMSSGQSAAGTRTCSGDPEADWRPANGEDAVTSEAVRCQTSLLIMHPDALRPAAACVAWNHANPPWAAAAACWPSGS